MDMEASLDQSTFEDSDLKEKNQLCEHHAVPFTAQSKTGMSAPET